MKLHFYGDNFTKEEHELRIMRIDPTFREGEADLFRSRWFDYAGMHPVRATYLYAHLYKEQTRIFRETCIDIETADQGRAFVPDDIFMSRDMTAMWLARRACDALGCPYDFALRFGQARAINRMMTVMLRPNQLYGEEFEIDLAVAWKESLAITLRYSRQETFKAKNYAGHLLQRRHVASVIEQIKKRHHSSHNNLLGRMLSEGVLDEKLAENHFTAEAIGAAQGIAATLAGQS